MLPPATIADNFTSKLSQPITELIQLVIVVGVVAGIVCLCKAWWDLHREKKELDYIKDKCQNGNFNKDEVRKLREADVPNGLQDDHPAEHITHRRLKVICDMLEARNKKAGADSAEANINLQAPQMSDLHQLSEQAILSYWAPTYLNIITAVLLICGICGTLWGVHRALQQGISSNLQGFAPALNPSKLAVFASVILILLRCCYAVGVDRFLRSLDRITMTLFLPSLIPSNDNSLKINKFFSHIEEYTQKLENSMVPVHETLSEIRQQFEFLGQQVHRMDNDCETLQFKLEGDVTQACETLERWKMPPLPGVQAPPPLPGEDTPDTDPDASVSSDGSDPAPGKAAKSKAKSKTKPRKTAAKKFWKPTKAKSSPPPLP